MLRNLLLAILMKGDAHILYVSSRNGIHNVKPNPISLMVLILAIIGVQAFCCEISWASPRIVWQAERLGKPSAELQLGPNGLFYLPAGNKLIIVNASGHKLLEIGGSPGAKGGLPVFDNFGSIFFPGGSLVQEIKLNGSRGWSFNVYQDGAGKAETLLTSGPGNFLYMPLADSLYVLDTLGRYKWSLLQWSSADGARSQPVAGREIMACAGNKKAIFVAYKDKGRGTTLVSVNGAGDILWRYWLGDIKTVNLAVAPDGQLYAAANPSKLDRLNRGKIYAFGSGDEGRLHWIYSIALNDITRPVVTGHGMLYFCASEQLFVIDIEHGQEVWRQTLSKAASRPAVTPGGERIYLGTSDGRLLAVSQQGRLVWDLTLDGAVTQSPFIGPDGYIYVITDKGSLYKIDDS